jgi:hypothetical protein
MSNLDFFRDPVTGRLYGPDTFADNDLRGARLCALIGHTWQHGVCNECSARASAAVRVVQGFGGLTYREPLPAALPEHIDRIGAGCYRTRSGTDSDIA